MTSAMCLTPSQCPAYVLSGGSSSRFGSDKALVDINGQPLILRIQQLLKLAGHETHFVADREDRYQFLGISCLVDALPNSGPLAGLTTAAKHRNQTLGGGWLLLLACDQVVWLPQLWQSLSSAAKANKSVVTFIEKTTPAGKRWQPLPGLYHSRLHDTALHALQAQQLSLQRLIAQTPSTGVTSELNPRVW